MLHLFKAYEQRISACLNEKAAKGAVMPCWRGEGFEAQTRQTSGDAECHQAARTGESVTFGHLLSHIGLDMA